VWPASRPAAPAGEVYGAGYLQGKNVFGMFAGPNPDLEKVLPGNVRLISIQLPHISGQGRVTLDMIVGAQAPEPVLDFLRRLEGSPLFGAAAVSTYMAPNQNDPLYRYRVSVEYAQKL